MTLNRNPDNYFAETEQVAFHPGHLVPGIDFSNDPLLQGRLFSYTDTQLSRLGSANFHELPINQPIAEVKNNQRDGHMRHAIIKGRVSYEPNTIGGGCPMQRPWEQGGFVSHPESLEGTKTRARSSSFADHFSQPALFWRSQVDWEKDHIVNAFFFELAKVEVPAIRERMVATLTQVDAVLAQRVANGLDMKLPAPPIGYTDVPYTDKPTRDAALSMANAPLDSIKGRKIEVLAANKVDGDALEIACRILEDAGATVKIIAPISGEINSLQGKAIIVDHSLATVGYVQFDAVFIPGGIDSAKTLCQNAHAVLFVNEAYKYGKAIVVADEGALLISKAARSGGANNHTYSTVGMLTSSGDKINAHYLNQFIVLIATHRFNERPDLDSIAA